MPASNESDEIRHLMKDKGYPHKRAIAAALSMKRAGKFGRSRRAKKRKSSR